jgi:putative oxidoreductase
MSYGLLLLRIVVGGTMFAHGAQKLFGWFGGHGLRGTSGFFGSLGYRAPLAMAALAGVAEAGGLAFAFGFLTPVAALGIAVVMLTAIGVVHWKNGFFNTDGGFEFNLTLLAAAIAVTATGPGRFSIDRLIGWDDTITGLWWTVGGLGVALAIAGLNLTIGRRPEPQVRPTEEPQDELRRAA